MTRQRLTRTAVGFVLAAVSAVALSLGGATSASAASSDVLLSTDGVTYTPTLTGGLFDGLGQLVPGESITASLWIKNPEADPATIRVTVADLVMPSAAFAAGVEIRSNDGATNRTAGLDALATCSEILSPRAIAAGGVVRVDITIHMLDTVAGLDAQNETASLDFAVAIRDAAAGPFPNAQGCPNTIPAADPARDPLAFTGARYVLPGFGFAVALLVGGLFLIIGKRRRREDDEGEVG
jgi:hypothetical protein